MSAFLDTSIESTTLLKMSSRVRDALGKLNIARVRDAVMHLPRRYEDRRRFDHFPTAPMDTAICLHVRVSDCKTIFGGRVRRFEAVVEPLDGDTLGNQLVLRWFNLSYLAKSIAADQQLVIYGLVKKSGRRLVMDHPDFEIVDDGEDADEAHMGRIVPVYRLASGIGQKPLRSLIHRLLAQLPDEPFPDWFPKHSAKANRTATLRTLHYPASLEDLEPARRCFALEEFVALQVRLLQRRASVRSQGGISRVGPGHLLRQFLQNLPFSPTGAQRRAVDEIRADLAIALPMSRLLQGDVGSGKTLVAAAAALTVMEAAYDAALMAPTQILAEQHFSTLRNWFEPLGLRVRLLTGNKSDMDGMPLFQTADLDKYGSLTVGTHALFHGRADFDKGLGLAIIDEQHKFGVAQRESLSRLGETVDVLVMSATPIPRTLTLSFYGDLDVSILDEMPPGRGKLITGIRSTTQNEAATDFLRQQLQAGRQAFIVYPLIDESEKLALGAATAATKEWTDRLPNHRVGLIHGRMAAEEKDRVMTDFRQGQIDVLVATTVIEVGVDVPNANTMFIYHAERFGLAQLHQLRGRIGRGEHKSYCVLILAPDQAEARDRLHILEQTSDGFRIAEEDLRQRGPGEVLGNAQSGLPDLKFADLLGDVKLVSRARKIAEEIVAKEGERDDSRS